MARGERIGFSAQASDSEAGLLGAEWYLDGRFLGSLYRSSLPDSSGASAAAQHADGPAADGW